MGDTRNWSTKTLAKQLALFLAANDIGADNSVSELIDLLKTQIVEQEVGLTLEPWSENA